jgi:DNA repair protein RAD5
MPPLSESASTFDTATFEAVIGSQVDSEAISIIREQCGNDIERAVNMYFDETWKVFRKPKRTARLALDGRTQAPFGGRPHKPDPASSSTANSRTPLPECRYIGAFGAAGWATRSGEHVLRHGDAIRIERQKIQPPANKGKGKSGIVVAQKRADILVRFTTSSGVEIGRLEKDVANWISTLIDQKVCKFEATCVFAPEKLRTNDTVFLQLRCYLRRSAFSSSHFQLAQNRSTGIFDEHETIEERGLRLRQIALVRLFQEINLEPVRVNATAAKQKRQSLLEAAEIAEKKEKEAVKSEPRCVHLISTVAAYLTLLQ